MNQNLSTQLIEWLRANTLATGRSIDNLNLAIQVCFDHWHNYNNGMDFEVYFLDCLHKCNSNNNYQYVISAVEHFGVKSSALMCILGRNLGDYNGKP